MENETRHWCAAMASTQRRCIASLRSVELLLPTLVLVPEPPLGPFAELASVESDEDDVRVCVGDELANDGDESTEFAVEWFPPAAGWACWPPCCGDCSCCVAPLPFAPAETAAPGLPAVSRAP